MKNQSILPDGRNLSKQTLVQIRGRIYFDEWAAERGLKYGECDG